MGRFFCRGFTLENTQASMTRRIFHVRVFFSIVASSPISKMPFHRMCEEAETQYPNSGFNLYNTCPPVYCKGVMV